MTCIICKITGCAPCLFAKRIEGESGICLMCALGPKCPIEKKVEIEDKRALNLDSNKIASTQAIARGES